MFLLLYLAEIRVDFLICWV